MILNINLYAQCDDGSEPECMCETAEVLCTIDELDGYMFSMSTFQHPEDGPDPLCEGADFTVPNNPTWFAFVAWCEEIDLNVYLTNCEPGEDDDIDGVQIAIYSSCGPDYDEIDCDVSIFDCLSNDDKELELEGLTIGDIYYFLVDGCSGAACDIEIDVIGVCGEEEIEDWTDGVEGEIFVCAGNTETYTADDLDGANLFHWYIDGVEIEQTETNIYDIDWDTAGEFELCVDASNDPCVPVDDEPEPFCITVNVYEVDAGQIAATPNPLCPGEFSTVNIENYLVADGVETVILVVDESDEIIEVGDPDELDVTSDICQTITVCSYNYSVNISTLPEVGLDLSDLDCPTECCDLECIEVSFEDEEVPEFPDAPGNEQYECEGLLPDIEDLEWTDNCDGNGFVSGEEDGVIDPCQGGSITRTWTYTDQCDNTTEYSQEISVDPVPEAEFIDPPDDVTLSCEAIPPDYEDLMYSNGVMSDCGLEGTEEPVVMEDFDPFCGGTIELEWEFTDDCDRTISHTQTITIDPAPEAVFLNTPADVTLSCADQSFTAEPLDFSNNTPGCLIDGSALPMVDDNSGICGGSITITWEFTDPCDRTISHTQNITIEESLPPSFINPPVDANIACDATIPDFDDLSYTNNDMGLCLIMGTVSPSIEDNIENCGGNIIATWEYTDECDRTITHTQTVTVDPPPLAMFINPPSNETMSCENIPNQPVNLEYTNNDGICPIEGEIAPDVNEDYDICGGIITNIWEFTDECDRTINHVQVLTIEPAPEAMFINLPPNLNFTCEEFDGFDPEDLEYTNNLTGFCEIAGFVSGEVDGEITECGGTLEVLYEYTDDCNRTISHTQTITVEPAPPAAFTSLPEAMTFECTSVDFIPEDLDYTNNGTGVCLIEGTISPIEAGDFDECGGTVSYIWTFTDNCNRTISHTQVITYLPAEDPVFTESPPDDILDCLGELPDDLELEYDNFLDNPCTVAGSVEPEITDNGTTILLTWTFTNPCTGNTIMEDQIWTVSIPVDFSEELVEVGICEGDAFDLSTIPAIDLNNTDPTISYHDDFPPDPSNELSSPIVSPDSDMTYWIFGNNEFDCPDWIEVEVNVDPLSVAGADNQGEICIEAGTMDLFFYLANDANFDGDFVQVSGPTDLDVSDGDDVNISNAEPGTYVFEYIIEATDYCPEDVAIITMELLPEIDIILTGIICSDDFQSYTVSIEFEASDIDINVGEFEEYNLNSAVITNIPIDEILEIEAEDDDTGCTGLLQISPPDCDCPDVEVPISGGDFVICFGDAIPELSVGVNGNSTANWYGTQVGGMALAEGTLNYTPDITDPGIYTFYVEAESLDDPGCVSQRIEITIEILSPPDYMDSEVSVCDIDFDQIFSFDSVTLQSNLDLNLSETIQFFASLADASSGMNELSFPWENTSPGNQTIYANITNSAGCQSTIAINLIINTKPEILLDINDESCPDLDDGSFEIINFNSNAQYFFDEVLLAVDSVGGLMPGVYELIVIDEFSCSDTTLVEILEGFEHSLISLSLECSDSGTNTDPIDDVYIISFNLENNQANTGNVEIFDQNNNSLGVFPYGSVQMITVPADGNELILTFVDVVSQCSFTESIGVLNPCSTNCIITVDLFEYVCNDNGTEVDPTDDFYEFQINVSAINGSSIDRYNLALNGVITFSFVYGQLSNFTYPADGTILQVGIIDAEDTACSQILNTEPLEPCSDACVIDILVENILCNDNGTDDNNDDDIFTFELNVSGFNLSDNFEILELGQQFNYNEVLSFGPFNISDGNIEWTIIDSDDPDCIYNLLVEAPMACSDCNQQASVSEPTELSCTEPTTQIEVTVSEQAIFLWSGPEEFSSADAVITVNIPGDYTVLITFFNGCTQSFTVTVTADNEIPIAVVGPDQLLTCISDIATLDASNSSYPDGAEFEWTDQFGNVISEELMLTVSQTGTYSFVIIDPATGCTSSVEQVIVSEDSNPPSVAIYADPGNILDCFVETIELSNDQEENVSYTWIVEEEIVETASVSIGDPGIISLLAIDTITGCENEAEINILDLTEFPIVIIEQDGEIDCESGSVCLDASSSPFADNLDFVWYDESGNVVSSGQQVLCVEQGGNYTLELTDNINGCKNSESIEVDAPILVNVELPVSISIETGTPLDLSAIVDIPLDQIQEIIWTPADILSCSDCLNPTVLEPVDGQVITVEVISITGCRSTATTILDEDIVIEVTIPNIINSGSTSGNDQITLYGNEFVKIIEDFYIYDRWGNLVFETHDIEPNNPTLGWDGRFNGQEAEQGVYVYLFNILIVNGEMQSYAGDVTLVR